MDVFSHGFYGGVAFGRKSRKDFLLAFLISVSPDAFSFGILWLLNWLGFYARPEWSSGLPDQNSIPLFIHTLYNFTHSLVIFGAVFLLVWFFRKKPWWILGAWGLHILIDIPSHSSVFFPTPFLWPLSDFRINGIGWGNPWIFYPDWILILILYALWFVYEKFAKNSAVGRKIFSKASIFVFLAIYALIWTMAVVGRETDQPKACSMEAKICPDGQAVGRIGPNCEFEPCP